MRLVPYTIIHPPTWEAVGPGAFFVAVDGDDDGYRRSLAEMWSREEDFVLVEHDVVPTAAQLTEIEGCSEPWCLYGYGPGFWQPVFGCVKFGRALIVATRDVWEQECPWEMLDQLFAAHAVAQGFRPHWHYPHVRHAATRGRRAASLEEKLLAAEAESALVASELNGDLIMRQRYEQAMSDLVKLVANA